MVGGGWRSSRWREGEDEESLIGHRGSKNLREWRWVRLQLSLAINVEIVRWKSMTFLGVEEFRFPNWV